MICGRSEDDGRVLNRDGGGTEVGAILERVPVIVKLSSGLIEGTDGRRDTRGEFFNSVAVGLNSGEGRIVYWSDTDGDRSVEGKCASD